MHDAYLLLLNKRSILRVGGIIRIAEVRSRFEGLTSDGSLTEAGAGAASAGKEGVKRFIRLLKKAGVDLSSTSSGSSVLQSSKHAQVHGGPSGQGNLMFFEIEGRKSTRGPESGLAFTAKACIYKKR